jgi:aminopeptidase-like protein
MSKSKHKVKKLTDEQYNAYISALRNDGALYCADGSQFVPREIDVKDKDKPKGD